VLAAGVTLAPLRDALLADARGAAARVHADAAAQVASGLAAARADAFAMVARARGEGEQRADREARRQISAQRRISQGRILAARRAAYESLRAEALAGAQRLRDEPAYPALLDSLEAAARARLGPVAVIERDPPASGGVIARDGGRMIDATLPALVERALADIGSEVEALWA